MVLGWMDTLVGKCCINSVKQRRQILSIAEPRDRWIQSGSRHIYGKLLRRFLSPWSFIMERYITWLPHSWPMTITTINCSFALLLWANYDRLYRCDDTILAKKKRNRKYNWKFMRRNNWGIVLLATSSSVRINHSSLRNIIVNIYIYVFCLYKYVAIIFRRGKTRFRLSSIVIRSSVIFHLSRRQIIRRLPVPRGVERNAINHINQAHKLCLDTRGHTPPDFKSQEATRSSFFCLRTLCVVYIYWDNKPQLWPSLTNRSPSLFFFLSFVTETKENDSLDSRNFLPSNNLPIFFPFFFFLEEN